MMLKVISILFLVYLAAGEKVININNETDIHLAHLNTVLTKFRAGVRPLPDVRYPDVKVQLLNGVQIGLNSWNRTAEATATIRDDETVVVDLHLGLQQFVVAYGLIKSGELETSGLYKINANSFHVSYTVSSWNSTRCRVKVGAYEWEKMADVYFSSSNPIYDGDVSQVFTKYALPRVNEKLSHLRWKVEKLLQRVICHHRKMEITEEMAKEFVSLAQLY